MFSLSQLITVVNWTEDKCFSHRKVSVSHSLLISATFDVIVDTSITFFFFFFFKIVDFFYFLFVYFRESFERLSSTTFGAI